MRTKTNHRTVYLDGVRSVEYLVSAMRPGDQALTVPATPRWNVRQLLSHIAGVASDTVEGRVIVEPGSRWTQRHVDERAKRPVSVLLAEIQERALELASMLEALRGPSPAWDIRVHEYDLREALGLAGEQRSSWQDVALGTVQLYNRREDAAGELRVDGLTVTLQRGGETLLSVGLYEFFRGVFSRRSRAQLCEWEWSDGVPDTTIDGIPFFFGQRTDAQPRLS